LLFQTFFLCIGITYLSLLLLDLLISNLLSSISALVFKLGQNLSIIRRSILLKQKFPLILLLQSTDLSDLKHFTILTFIRAQSFHILPLLIKNSHFYLSQRTKLSVLTCFLPIGLLFFRTNLHKLSRVLCTRATDLHIEISQFKVGSSHKASSFSVSSNHIFRS
jgi:hypothetical protein